MLAPFSMAPRQAPNVGRVALCGVLDSADGADEALARDGADERIAERGDLGGLALDDDVLVDRLTEAGAGIEADAIAIDAGAHERAGAIG